MDDSAYFNNRSLSLRRKLRYRRRTATKTLAEDVCLFSVVLEESLQRAGAQLTSELTATRARLSELNERLDVYVHCCFSVSLLAYAMSSQCPLQGKTTSSRWQFKISHTFLTYIPLHVRGMGIACVPCLAAGAVGAGIALFTLNPFVAIAAAVRAVPRSLTLIPRPQGAIIGGIGAGG